MSNKPEVEMTVRCPKCGVFNGMGARVTASVVLNCDGSIEYENEWEPTPVDECYCYEEGCDWVGPRSEIEIPEAELEVTRAEARRQQKMRAIQSLAHSVLMAVDGSGDEPELLLQQLPQMAKELADYVLED